MDKTTRKSHFFRNISVHFRNQQAGSGLFRSIPVHFFSMSGRIATFPEHIRSLGQFPGTMKVPDSIFFRSISVHFYRFFSYLCTGIYKNTSTRMAGTVKDMSLIKQTRAIRWWRSSSLVILLLSYYSQFLFLLCANLGSHIENSACQPFKGLVHVSDFMCAKLQNFSFFSKENSFFFHFAQEEPCIFFPCSSYDPPNQSRCKLGAKSVIIPFGIRVSSSLVRRHKGGA